MKVITDKIHNQLIKQLTSNFRDQLEYRLYYELDIQIRYQLNRQLALSSNQLLYQLYKKLNK